MVVDVVEVVVAVAVAVDKAVPVEDLLCHSQRRSPRRLPRSGGSTRRRRKGFF
jgi:hypothetical protein